MRRAEPGHEEDRDRFRGASEQQWRLSRSRFVANKWQKPTLYLRRAGTGLAVADTVDWLVLHPAERGSLNDLGGRVHSEVFGRDMAAAARACAANNPDFARYGSHTAGHFWCELISELARGLHEIGRVTDRVPQDAKEMVLESESAPDWGSVRTALASIAIDGLWKAAQAVFVLDTKAAARALRLLALLICPDPGGHERVAKACLSPLAHTLFSQETQGRLEFARLLE
ncbi:hypothetical protein [Nocardiopsis salina]|uniref:hypothetical protein n=1 Tax=Nocardiopsis salina TaxID=245836 RepID=UPI000348AE9E|nr:hypothetical protein [Nocardiopsis salina]